MWHFQMIWNWNSEHNIFLFILWATDTMWFNGLRVKIDYKKRIQISSAYMQIWDDVNKYRVGLLFLDQMLIE